MTDCNALPSVFFPYKSRHRITLFAETAILINLEAFLYLFLGSLNINQNRFSQLCRSSLRTRRATAETSSASRGRRLWGSIGFSLFPRPFDCLSRASTLTKVSSSHVRPARTTPSQCPSRAENTFASQYFPALSAFLLSRADVLTEWNSKRWSRNYTHSDSGIFLEPTSLSSGTSSERPKRDQSGS